MKGPRYTWRQYARAAGLYGCLWVVAACTQCGWLSARVEMTGAKAGRDQVVGSGNLSGNTVTTSAPIASGNRIATTMTAEVASGNAVTTTQGADQSGPVKSPTTQSAAAQSGDKGTAIADASKADGSKIGPQQGLVNFNWAPVAAGGAGLAWLTLVAWLIWSSRTQKRETDARLAEAKINTDADKHLVDRAFDLARDAIAAVLRMGGPS